MELRCSLDIHWYNAVALHLWTPLDLVPCAVRICGVQYPHPLAGHVLQYDNLEILRYGQVIG